MIAPALVATALFGLFVLLLLLEQVTPLRGHRRDLFGRLLVNLAMSAVALATAMLLVRPAALAALQWASDRSFGVVRTVSLPPAVQFVLSFLLMDLTFYWWHVANHRIPLLWRFHNVHHVDPDLDVSTAFRFHAGEVALSTIFRVVQIAALGVSAGLLVAYEAVFQANTMFHHSNVRLPLRLERLLNLILVTPRMHGIHHSQVRGETNSNYSVVFSWWDRLHRTIWLNTPQSDIRIGVPGYSSPHDNGLWSLLLLPFRRQRQYWRKSVL